MVEDEEEEDEEEEEVCVAVVPQTPWIIGASLRANILLGRRYEESRYIAVSLCVGGLSLPVSLSSCLPLSPPLSFWIRLRRCL